MTEINLGLVTVGAHVFDYRSAPHRWNNINEKNTLQIIYCLSCKLVQTLEEKVSEQFEQADTHK